MENSFIAEDLSVHTHNLWNRLISWIQSGTHLYIIPNRKSRLLEVYICRFSNSSTLITCRIEPQLSSPGCVALNHTEIYMPLIEFHHDRHGTPHILLEFRTRPPYTGQVDKSEITPFCIITRHNTKSETSRSRLMFKRKTPNHLTEPVLQ